MSTPTRAQVLTVLSAIPTASLSGCTISQELPWVEANRPLYLKNPKRVYVDRIDRGESTVLGTLDNSVRAVDRTSTVRVYVTVDAKNQPAGWETTVEALANIKNSSAFATQSSRECNITQEYQDDLLVNTFEFQFTEFVVN